MIIAAPVIFCIITHQLVAVVAGVITDTFAADAAVMGVRVLVAITTTPPLAAMADRVSGVPVGVFFVTDW